MTKEAGILFSPYEINDITLANRFVMPAMQRGRCEQGCPSSQMAEYYRNRVEGGISLVVGESTAIDHPSATSQAGAATLGGQAAQAWQRCIEAVKSAGGQMLIQLWHEGAVRKQPGPDSPSLSPSGLIQANKANGREASEQELHDIRDAFVRSAVTAKNIGATGVEIHAAHGYFLDLFLWSQTNRRTDRYGGDRIEQRLTYPTEIVSAVRAAVGSDFLISFRFSQWKEVDFDAEIVGTPDQLQTMVKLLEDAGVDIFSVSTPRIFKAEWLEISTLGLAGWTRSFTEKPVIAVGSVGLDTDLMENLFGKQASPTGASGLEEITERCANGEFDLLAIGRAIIGDADWVNKAQQGRWAEMKPFSKEDMMTEWEMDFVLEAHRQ